MTKKKTTPQAQLSPENYIRQRSRSLPVYKCFINESWEEDRLCSIFITRQHVTGNATCCLYLVDLQCLGVKNTGYYFNVPFQEIEQMIHQGEEVSFVEIPYELAHNIIFAAIEYAEEYGFKPHKDFTSITAHFLEEDNDEIPFLEIQCGDEDGKPLYMNTGFDTPAREKQILAQLERTAGNGNYHYILEDDDIDDDMDDEFLAEVAGWDTDKQKKLLIELYDKEKQGKQLTDDEAKTMVVLTGLLIFHIVDQDELKEQLDIWEKKFEFTIVEEAELPNSLFTDIQSDDGEKLSEQFYEILDVVYEGKNPKSLIEKFRKEAGDAPIVSFLELHYLIDNQKKNAGEKLTEAYQKFPNYFLFQYYYFIIFNKGNIDLKFFEKLITKQKLPITQFEAEIFFLWYVIFYMMNVQVELPVVLALELFISHFNFFSEDAREKIFYIFYDYKIKTLIEHFAETPPPQKNYRQ